MPLIILIYSMLLTSCTEVIDLDLNAADPKLTIEATLTNSPLNNQVILTKSSSFEAAGTYERISDAVVTLSDADGQSFTLTESDQGVYTHPTLVGEVEKSYQLSVSYEDITYEATSFLPQPITIDSVTYEYSTRTPFRDEGYLLQVHFDQHSAIDSYVRFWIQVNGVDRAGYFLYNGALPVDEGGTYRFLSTSFQRGEEVTIIAGAIDQDVYSYYAQLAEVTGNGMGPGAAAPANPTSNISNDALGYFGALGISVTTVVVE